MLIFYSDLFFLKYSCFRIEFDIGGNPIILVDEFISLC
jgi:hypothetical protein